MKTKGRVYFIYYCFFPRFVAQPEIYEKRVLDFSQGEINSPCLKPCLRTQVGTPLIPNAIYVTVFFCEQITGFKTNQEIWAFTHTQLTFSIDDTVEITEYRYADLNFPNLCAEIGGALGLWLGLGIIQLFQEGLGIVRRLQVMFNETE